MMAARQVDADNSSVRARSSAAKDKEKDKDRKVVFRSVLDNPTTVDWPSFASTSAATTILNELITFLSTPAKEGDLAIADWRANEHARRRGRVHGAGKLKKLKAAQAAPAQAEGGGGAGEEEVEVEEGEEDLGDQRPPSKRAKLSPKEVKSHQITLRSNTSYSIPNFVDPARPSADSGKKKPPAQFLRPRVLDHLAIGINEVTKAVESKIRWARWELGDKDAAPTQIGDEGKEVGTAEGAEKTKSKHRRKRKSVTKNLLKTSAIPPPLDYSKPSLPTTLRPSFRFLSLPIPKPSSKLPSYLLPPAEPLPFFRMLANSERDKLKASQKASLQAEISGGIPKKVEKQKRIRELLKGVIESDNPEGERSLRVGTNHLVKKLSERREKEDKEKLDKKKALRAGVKRKTLHFDVEEEKKKIEAEKAVDELFEQVNQGKGGSGASKEKEKATDDDDTTFKVEETVPLIDIIFVCKPDINPPSLVAHLPTMIAASNGVRLALIDSLSPSTTSSSTPTTSPVPVAGTSKDVDMEVDGEAEGEEAQRPSSLPILLVPLPIGSEQKLANILGLRRVACIGISSQAPNALSLYNSVKSSLPTSELNAAWLIPHLTSFTSTAPSTITPRFIPTHIKHLKTTAPLDPKKSNMEKKERRKIRKEVGRGEVYVAED